MGVAVGAELAVEEVVPVFVANVLAVLEDEAEKADGAPVGTPPPVKTTNPCPPGA